MANYRTSRIVPIILVVIIIVIAIAAIVSLARVVFFSGPSTPTVVDSSRDALLSTTAGRSVTMSVRGPIVADEVFNSYKITISPNQRVITTYTGYLDKRVDSITLGNNVKAYEEFVHALDKANLPKGVELQGDRNDVRGICATGRVYEYGILNDEKSVKTLWTSTCKGSRGSLDASVEQLTELFVKQIPNADKLIRQLKL